MNLNDKSINELKYLSAQIVSNAKSGHTGSAIGASSILFALFKDHLMFIPKDPKFINRDRFVLSAGHLSALYYSLLHLFGYKISSNDLKQFRCNGSITPGHPEVNMTPGIEVSTGPLGQGIANAVGLAIGETMLAEKINKYEKNLINNYTFCLCGDGCLMEGVALEACSLAGTLNLNKLILLYDNNDITIDGTRQSANNEDIELKFKAMNWNVLTVKNGNCYEDCSKAIAMAKESNKPTIIIFKTKIGIGTNLENQPKIHSYPMPSDELAKFKEKLNVTNNFSFSQDVFDYCKQTINKNEKLYNKFLEILNNSKHKTDIESIIKNKQVKINYNNLLKYLADENVTGRKMASLALNYFSDSVQNFVGGCADVAASTLAYISNGGDYSTTNRSGKNIHFGIREHAMGAICNGVALYNGSYVFDSTFLAFSNYMTPAIRMSTLMNLPILNIFTHDSINIGQDGPTHQPIEQLGNLRSIVNLQTFRPANATELVAAYKYYFDTKSPTSLILSKSNMLEQQSNLEDAEKGGYVIYKNHTSNPEITIIATGTEVELAILVSKHMQNINTNVVSIPCEEIFSSQPKKYIESVIPKNSLKVVIEASNDNIWYKYLSPNDLLINVTSYSHSGNGSDIYKSAGFDDKKISLQIINKLSKKTR